MNTEAEIQKVRQIGAVCKSIVDAYFDNVPVCPFGNIDAVPPSENAPYTVYFPSLSLYGGLVLGKHACLADIPEDAKRGLKVWNECDLVTLSLFPSFERRITSAIPGAMVGWLCSVVKPGKFMFSVRSDQWIEPSHSAFVVTLPEGSSFVVDMTIEQFGHPKECWFMPYLDYLGVIGCEEWSVEAYADQAEKLESILDDQSRYARGILQRVCGEIQWEEVERMFGTDREAMMDQMVYRMIYEPEPPEQPAVTLEQPVPSVG